MKVGIITMPLCANYGGIIQNWALQQVLIKMGNEPITLRFPVLYQGMSSMQYWSKLFPRQILRYIYHRFKYGKADKPLTIGQWKKSVSGMERFISEQIIVSEFLRDLNMDDIRRHGIEALIVGSDQIWRPVKYDAAKYYFLGFAKDSEILRIAYAPSIAQEEWPYTLEVTAQLRKLIKKFSAVSVREKSSVQLVENHLGVEVQWVLDPTMLLKKEDYLKVCKKVPQSGEEFVFAYILDMTEEKRIMVEQIEKKYGCGARYLSADKVKADDTIEKWLANFRDAKFVITDSYHGAVFSLLLQKQFYCFYNKYRGNARMDSLKEISGLDERFINDVIEYHGAVIDYEKVEERIDVMRNASLAFLASSLRNSL